MEAALAWVRDGAEWIHLVDLDAAFGRGSNAEALALVVRAVDEAGVAVELSGGIRDDDSLARALATGCRRVNLGTAALEDPGWTRRAIAEHGDRIAVGLDVRGTTLAARGWTQEGGDLWETLARLDADGCARYVVTDVTKDGTMRGPNVELLAQVCAATDRPVVASGGISSLADLEALRALVGRRRRGRHRRQGAVRGRVHPARGARRRGLTSRPHQAAPGREGHARRARPPGAEWIRTDRTSRSGTVGPVPEDEHVHDSPAGPATGTTTETTTGIATPTATTGTATVDDPTEARGFAAYRRVLAVRGMPSLYLVGVLARLPHVGGGLALTLYVVEGLGRGYLAAGLVTAALTVGIALGSPWRGRLVDRVGLRRALVPSIVAMPVLWTVAAFSPYAVLLPVALLAGLLAVPVFTVVRQAIGVMVPEHSRRAGFALDSVLVEASFVAGPPMVVVAVTQVGPEVALVAIGIGEALSGVILAWLDPRLRDDPAADDGEPDLGTTTTRGGDRPARRRLPLPRWMTPGLLAMYACSFGTAFVLSGSEVGVIAVLRGLDRVEFIAWVFAVWGVASGVGGLVYGAVRRGASSPLVLLAWLSLARCRSRWPRRRCCSCCSSSRPASWSRPRCRPARTA